ncbi:MAG: type II toxin-antitoxin system VapC family toxin [Nitrospirae bacterium]|nr:type II toxin-antitoxin system VapC family toxin [Nitrospirota bacterium]
MKLFVDTSAWFALHDSKDQNHKEAVLKSLEIKKRKVELVTSEYIMDESITLIRHKVSHKASVVFGESLLFSNIVTIMDVSQDDRLKAWELFKKYEDKSFSFTDCTSFVLMKNSDLRKAFTFDEHFKQIGIDIF